MQKLQYFGHLMQRADSLGKTLMMGKIEGQQRMRQLDGITNSMNTSFEQTLGDGEGRKSLTFCSLWGCKELDMTY